MKIIIVSYFTDIIRHIFLIIEGSRDIDDILAIVCLHNNFVFTPSWKYRNKRISI